MKLATIAEAARILGIDSQQLRRRVVKTWYPHYVVEGRLLVDVEEIAALLERERATIGIPEAAELTGLTQSAIRRGAKGGWLPCERIGNAYRFVPARLLEALEGTKKE